MKQQRSSSDQVAAVHIERGVPFGKVDGRTLFMNIARSDTPSTALLLAVLDIRGGGWAEGECGVRTDSILPNNGFFFCSIHYWLSGEAPFPAQIHDCKAAVRWLRANADPLGIDLDRSGAWGVSAGGHLAELLGTSAGVMDLEGDSGTPDVPTMCRRWQVSLRPHELAILIGINTSSRAKRPTNCSAVITTATPISRGWPIP
jgi:acetyl esterase/lipase